MAVLASSTVASELGEGACTEGMFDGFVFAYVPFALHTCSRLACGGAIL